jgi:peptidoglycan/xylan/chitin deacetylase (PgdA/CDA1 family)
MKKSLNFLLITLLITLNNALFSQTIPKPYEVGTWSGFRTAAISYTFDDGCPNQFKIAIPLFDEYGFKLTLFTVSSWVTSWPALQSAADSGHEVASHTVTHPDFSKIKLDKQESELKNSKIAIESHITGENCITMAYPYCVPGADTVCGKYYISARGCQGFIEPKTPGSYFNVSSVICGNLGAIKTLNDFKLKFVSAAKINGWLVFLIHGIDNDGGYSPIASAELRKSVEYLDARRSKFWVTTFLNATLYSKERNAVKVEEISATDSSFNLQVTDTLPDSTYNFPLTLRRPLPENWPSADVIQDSIAVPKRIIMVDSVTYLTFDIVPDAGEVKITKNLTPVIPEIDSIPADDTGHVSVNQIKEFNADIRVIYNNGKLNISLTDYTSKDLLIRIYDIRGIELFFKKLSYAGENEIAVELSENYLNSGVYLICLSDGKNSWNRKITVT